MTEKYKSGNIVVLKSGGPAMTVERLIVKKDSTGCKIEDETREDKGRKYGCNWFAGKSNKYNSYYEDELDFYTENEKK